MPGLAKDSRRRRWVLALAIYVAVAGTFFATCPRDRLTNHTNANHFALLADAWLKHRLDLPHAPPSYAGNNDFAEYGSKWFIAFPPFPAVLLLPVAWLAKNPDKVRDGQFFVWLAGIAPAVLFLVLEKLRRTGRSTRSELTNVELSLLFAFGSVYFFTSLQGTVWFAAHVVGAALVSFYLLFSLDAAHPVLAGLMLGLGFLTRTPLLFAAPFFLFEAVRVSLRPEEGTAEPTLRRALSRLRLGSVLKVLALFAIPVVLSIVLACAHNVLRFGKPLDFGYQYLTVAWAARMKKWGLFNYHYLAKNLAVVLTGLPFVDPARRPYVQVNMHGLALWLTTPLYLWLVWPKRVTPLAVSLYVTAAAVAIPGLLYQNTGWMQFGYRFSNDYAPILFALLAVTENHFGKLFTAAAVWSVAVNAFGAMTFDRPTGRQFYFEDASQNILFQQD